MYIQYHLALLAFPQSGHVNTRFLVDAESAPEPAMLPPGMVLSMEDCDVLLSHSDGSADEERLLAALLAPPALLWSPLLWSPPDEHDSASSSSSSPPAAPGRCISRPPLVGWWAPAGVDGWWAWLGAARADGLGLAKADFDGGASPLLFALNTSAQSTATN